jgi:diacylglycerol kinase (ATP)
VRRRFFVIHNPSAGLRRRSRFERVISILCARGCHVSVRVTHSEDDNRPLVEAAMRAGEFDAVVAAGGDGTVRSVASSLVGSEMPLGLIPIGTGNVLAHEIGLQLEADAIADCLLEGRIALVPTAHANGEPFLLMAGVGFDGRVIGRLDVELRQRLGKLAYVWPVIRALLEGPESLRVCIDGDDNAASWVVASAVRHYAGAFVIAPAARLDEPRLEVVLFGCKGRWSMLAQLIAIGLGRIGNCSDIRHLPGTAIEITSDGAVPVQIDGEPRGTTPISIRAGGPALHLITPPSSDARPHERS